LSPERDELIADRLQLFFSNGFLTAGALSKGPSAFGLTYSWQRVDLIQITELKPALMRFSQQREVKTRWPFSVMINRSANFILYGGMITSLHERRFASGQRTIPGVLMLGSRP